MRVFACSKLSFDTQMLDNKITDENVEEKKKTCFISINETIEADKYDELKPYFKSNHNNVLVLFFDDVEEDTPITIINTGAKLMAKAFTRKQGKQVIEFLEQNKTKEYFMVHCAAGISRSGAVATFINDYFNGDRERFLTDNPYIHPNGTVLSILNRLIKEKEYKQLEVK